MVASTETAAMNHVRRVCLWHARTSPECRPAPDPAWAQRWLARLEGRGSVTQEAAGEIRLACGWD